MILGYFRFDDLLAVLMVNNSPRALDKKASGQLLTPKGRSVALPEGLLTEAMLKQACVVPNRRPCPKLPFTATVANSRGGSRAADRSAYRPGGQRYALRLKRAQAQERERLRLGQPSWASSPSAPAAPAWRTEASRLRPSGSGVAFSCSASPPLIVAGVFLALGGNIALVVARVGVLGLQMGLTQGLLAPVVADRAPVVGASAFDFASGLALLAVSVTAANCGTTSGPRRRFLSALFYVLALIGVTAVSERLFKA